MSNTDDSLLNEILTCHSDRNELTRIAEDILQSDEKQIFEKAVELRTSSATSTQLGQFLTNLLQIAYYRSLVIFRGDNIEKEKKSAKVFLSRVYIYIIEDMKRGYLVQNKHILDCLFEHIDHLTSDEASEIALKIVNRFDPSDANRVAGHSKALELLPQLSMKGGERARFNVIERLLNVEWRGSMAVMLASALIECCTTINFYEKAAEQIAMTITSTLKHLSKYLNSHTEDDEIEVDPDMCVELEDIPQLLYHLTLICNKFDSQAMPSELSLRIVNCISECTDTLLALYLARDKDQLTRVGISCSRIENVCLTICHHMSLTVAKDKIICNQIIILFKQRNLGTSSQFYAAYVHKWHQTNTSKSSIVTSPTLLLLAFVVAQSPREESKVTAILIEMITEVYALDERSMSSLWFQRAQWSGTLCHLSRESLKNGFEFLFTGPLMFDLIVRPIMNMAFAFIDASKAPSPAEYKWGKITTSVIDCIVRQPARQENVDAFGAWLALKLFVHCKHARSQIIREIVQRLASASTATTTDFSPFRPNNKLIVANLCLFVLESACSDCRLGMLDVNTELHELFMYLAEYSSSTASRLIDILSPLFKACNGMGDRCSIALRKACFSKDCSSRQAAVSAILALLRSHLKATSTSSSSSSSQEQEPSLSRYHEALRFQERLKQRVVTGLSIEEIMVLLKRFLQHQGSVRSVLYKDIYDISVEFPEFRSIAMRLLRGHLLSLMVEDTSDVEQRNRSTTYGSCLKLDFTKIFDEMGRLQENFKDLIMTLLSFLLLEVSQEERDFDLFSQTGGTQQISATMSYTQRDTSTLSKEGIWVCEALWTFASTLASLDLENFASNSPQSQTDLVKLELLFSTYYVALVIVTIVPQSLLERATDDERKLLLSSLLKKSKACINVANKYVRNQKMAKEKDKKDKRSKGSAAVEGPVDHVAEEAVVSSSAVSSVHDSQLAFGFQLLTELRFISKLMSTISLMATGDEDEDLTDDYVVGMLLERVVICLERVILHYQQLGFNYVGSNHTNNEEFKFDIVCIIKSLFPSLSRCLMLLRTNILGSDIERKSHPLLFLSLPVLNATSTCQLVLRAMLGCLKVMISLQSPDVSPESFIVNISDMIDSSHANSVENDNGMSIRTCSVLGDEIPQRNIKTCMQLIEQNIGHYIQLMVSMQSDEDSVYALTPLTVVLIGDLFGCLQVISPRFDKSVDGLCDPRPMLTERILEECKNKFRSPSAALSTCLTQLLLLRCPIAPIDRLNKTFLLSQLIQECIVNTVEQHTAFLERFEEEEATPDNEALAEHMSIETFSLLSTNTVTTTSLCVLGILDKAFNEVVLLMKCLDKVVPCNEAGENRGVESKAPIYPVMRKLCQVLSVLVSPVLGDLCLEKALTSATRVYKIVVMLIKDIFIVRPGLLPPTFKALLSEISDNLTDKIQAYFKQTNGNNEEKSIQNNLFRGSLTSTKRKRGSNPSLASSNKLSKAIPQLIFQMEQTQTQLIKLSAVLTIEKTFINKLVKRSQVRDFQIKIKNYNEENSRRNVNT